MKLFWVISGHSLGESYPSAEIQSVYYEAPGTGPRGREGVT